MRPRRRPALPRALQLTQGPPQRFDFLIVHALLALGQLQTFQHFVHVIECFPERVDDLVNLFDRLLNRRRRRRTPLGAGPVRNVPFDGTGFGCGGDW